MEVTEATTCETVTVLVRVAVEVRVVVEEDCARAKSGRRKRRRAEMIGNCIVEDFVVDEVLYRIDVEVFGRV